MKVCGHMLIGVALLHGLCYVILCIAASVFFRLFTDLYDLYSVCIRLLFGICVVHTYFHLHKNYIENQLLSALPVVVINMQVALWFIS